MPDYKAMYFHLAASVADAIELLIKAQQQGENEYIESEPAPVVLLDTGKEQGSTPHRPK